MSGYNVKPIIMPFSRAVSENDVKTCTQISQPEFIICNLLELSAYLIDLVNHTTIFGTTIHDLYSPSLKTLYDRLHSGYLTISPLSGIAKDAQRLKAMLGVRLRGDVTERPLEDFEDLYYAVIGRMKDMVQILNARLESGFSTATDTIFVDGPSIEALCASLAEYWDALNEPACVRALDDAIRQSRIDRLYEEINAELESNAITQADADELLKDLYDSRESTEGIAYIAGWSPAMIGAWLEEKYLVLMKVEQWEAKRQARELKARAKRVDSLKGSVKGSVRKNRTRSPSKTLSIEKIFQKMDIGTIQAYGEGVMQVEQPRPEQHKVISQNTNHNMNVETGPQGHHESTHHHNDHATEWQLKSQRVSEYFEYLRNAASNDARSIIHQTKYQSAGRRMSQKIRAQGASNSGAEFMKH